MSVPDVDLAVLERCRTQRAGISQFIAATVIVSEIFREPPQPLTSGKTVSTQRWQSVSCAVGSVLGALL